jgi:restriction system protein
MDKSSMQNISSMSGCISSLFAIVGILLCLTGFGCIIGIPLIIVAIVFNSINSSIKKSLKENEKTQILKNNEQIQKEKEANLLLRECRIKCNLCVKDFVKIFINQERYPYEINLQEDQLKALQLLINEQKSITVEINILKKLVEEEIYNVQFNVFKKLFLKQNSSLVDNKNIKSWISAYVNTFDENLEYANFLTDMLVELSLLTEVYTLILESAGAEIFEHCMTGRNPNKFNKFLEIIGIDKQEIDDILEKHFIGYDDGKTTPIPIKEGIKKDEAENIKNQLEEIGTIVTLKKDVKEIQEETAYPNYRGILESLKSEIHSRHIKNLANNYKEAIENNHIILENMTIENIDSMDGFEFERFLTKLYSHMGYKVEHTKLSGDQGADLIIEKFGERTVVQAKRYSGAVSNSAIQEAVAAKAHYNSCKAIVVTNSYFTKSAMELASSNQVELWDREVLTEKLRLHAISK